MFITNLISLKSKKIPLKLQLISLKTTDSGIKDKDRQMSHKDRSQRQRSKQICYGILYGMGPKSLAEQMGGQDITEEEAIQFMSSFKSAYPEVQNYIEEVIANCRKQVSINNSILA